jgi:hypothetical protein
MLMVCHLCFPVGREKELAQLSELEMLKREGEVARIKAEAQAKEEAERRMEQVNLRAIKVGEGYRSHQSYIVVTRHHPIGRREGRCNMPSEPGWAVLIKQYNSTTVVQQKHVGVSMR